MYVCGTLFEVDDDYVALFDEAIGFRVLDQRGLDDQQEYPLFGCAPRSIEDQAALSVIADQLMRSYRHRPADVMTITTDTAWQLFLQGILTPEHFRRCIEDWVGRWIDIPGMSVLGRCITLRILQDYDEDVVAPVVEAIEVPVAH